MRFVLANAALFIFMATVLSYQYFFRSPLESAAITVRSPAATSVLSPKPVDEKAPIEKVLAEMDWKYNLNCKDSEKEIFQKHESVILNLKKCGREFPKEITVENQTNGFTASVFNVSESYSKTDSIPLKKGKNVITIRYLLAKAKASPPTPVVEKLILQNE